MKRLAVLCLFIGFSLNLKAEQKPNIIYIMADDLGIGDVGCYGQKLLKTPRIDRLAAEGMKFTNHYSGSAMCAPTRSCLMQGLHTGHARVRSNGDGNLRDEDITVGEVLQSAGYKTGAMGKWGIGEAGSTGIPTKQGFDYWFGYLNQTKAHHHYPEFLWKNQEQVFFPDNPEQRTHFSHDLFTEEALKFIRDHKDEPFFLYVPYTLVHVDLDVPDDSRDPWVGKIEETDPYGTPGGQHYIYQDKPHATFAGMVSRLDRDVGKIVDLVDELGLDKNTLVIFTSDNGPTSAGGADPKFFDGNGPYRGIKFEFYEGGIRCPMIARWPGQIEAKSESDHISAHWDLLATAADIAGANLPEKTDGISFLPTLIGNSEAQKQHPYLYWECASGKGVQAARMGNWKAVVKGTRSKGNEKFELFDLGNDIAETTNLAAARPEITAQMKQILQSARTLPEDKDDDLFLPAKPKKKKTKKKN
ncbi:MAG: arylsulfatase [Verrucomicrobiales bacterium]|nr:arylsulfatase [Verrucomicrobiales bacterium]